uniref:ZZ-type domain-containing protein n=1 Tax=Macrostomum lignano TaxID=282301 RepID=A0A1I8GRI6_9PLAT
MANSTDEAAGVQRAEETYEQLKEERDRYRRELQELSKRLDASAGIVRDGLLKKFEALEGCIRTEWRQSTGSRTGRFRAARRNCADIRYPALGLEALTDAKNEVKSQLSDVAASVRFDPADTDNKSSPPEPAATDSVRFDPADSPLEPAAAAASVRFDPADSGNKSCPPEPAAATTAASVRFDPADSPPEPAAASVRFDPADSPPEPAATSVRFDPAGSHHSRLKLFSSVSSDPASQGTSLELSSPGSSEATSVGDSEERPLASDSLLNEPPHSELQFSFEGCQSAFPPLPNSRLARLGLLPASLAELRAANESVSIVDPNCRYRMEGPAADEPETPTSSANDPAVEDRIRDLAISFANDAATISERARRAGLARASLEANFDEELGKLLKLLDSAALAGTGEAAAEASRSVQLLADIGAGLSRTAQTLGAVEQECRLNFAFHLILRHSEELRTDKEKMSGELELLRQAVEDDQFYTDADSSLSSRYGSSKSAAAGVDGATGGVKGRAKFQQLGRSVARTSSVTALLQRLARERERRRRQQQRRQDGAEAEPLNECEENGASQGDEAADATDSSRSENYQHRRASVEDRTVLDRLDRVSVRLFADRRVRLFLAPLTLLVATVCLLWAIAYPIVKRLIG